MNSLQVTFTESGYLHLTADVARRFFPNDALVAVRRGQGRGTELWLMPLLGPGGGLLLKQRNPQGDRSVLIWEFLPEPPPLGERPAFWDERQGVLRVALGAEA